MKKVIFLDRDGVINIDPQDYVFKIENFHFTPNLFSDLKKLQNLGFQFILITNQGGISRKIYNKEDVITVLDYMKSEFEKHGIQLIDMYYCPHHNTIEKCLCRKPLGLMIEKAAAKHNINKKQSYMIGDSYRDIEAAKHAGVKGIKIEANSGINKAVQQILNESNN